MKAACRHHDWTVWSDGNEPIATSLTQEQAVEMVDSDETDTYYAECGVCDEIYEGT